MVAAPDDTIEPSATPPGLDLFSKSIDEIERGTPEADSFPVFISYEIIRLFSEGLYQSPQKAIEELVSNSYDANATQAHVILPDAREAQTGEDGELPPLWVIDDGHGLDRDGFVQLWRIADSQKATAIVRDGERAPIGQFGIGKLAAYVLAWRLTHISRVNDGIRLTSMNFRRLVGRHQYAGAEPVDLQVREIDEPTAQGLLSYVKERDPVVWDLMFGEARSRTWTAAGLSDFKQLYSKLSTGRLAWVLRTGLPLHSRFSIWLDGEPLQSSKEDRELIASYPVGGNGDVVAMDLGFATSPKGVRIPGIDGDVQGEARIFKDRITGGKSSGHGRSNGFFIRVRGRVINLEDELFGLPALNHSAWSRFSMEVDAEGLQTFLLSSREGVRESDETRLFQRYLLGMFNQCRRAFDDDAEKKATGLDLSRLLSDAPSTFVVEPVIEGVRRALEEAGESYYSDHPEIGDRDPTIWLSEFAEKVAERPFDRILHEGSGIYERVVRYIPETRTLIINSDHPFIDKLLETGKTQAAAT